MGCAASHAAASAALRSGSPRSVAGELARIATQRVARVVETSITRRHVAHYGVRIHVPPDLALPPKAVLLDALERACITTLPLRHMGYEAEDVWVTDSCVHFRIGYRELDTYAPRGGAVEAITIDMRDGAHLRRWERRQW